MSATTKLATLAGTINLWKPTITITPYVDQVAGSASDLTFIENTTYKRIKVPMNTAEGSVISLLIEGVGRYSLSKLQIVIKQRPMR